MANARLADGDVQIDRLCHLFDHHQLSALTITDHEEFAHERGVVDLDPLGLFAARGMHVNLHAQLPSRSQYPNQRFH